MVDLLDQSVGDEAADSVFFAGLEALLCLYPPLGGEAPNDEADIGAGARGGAGTLPNSP